MVTVPRRFSAVSHRPGASTACCCDPMRGAAMPVAVRRARHRPSLDSQPMPPRAPTLRPRRRGATSPPAAHAVMLARAGAATMPNERRAERRDPARRRSGRERGGGAHAPTMPSRTWCRAARTGISSGLDRRPRSGAGRRRSRAAAERARRNRDLHTRCGRPEALGAVAPHSRRRIELDARPELDQPKPSFWSSSGRDRPASKAISPGSGGGGDGDRGRHRMERRDAHACTSLA